MPPGKISEIIVRAIAIPVVLIAIIIGLLSYADVSIPLEGARKQFVSKASQLVGHEVRIDGEVRLAISFYPTLVVDKLHIVNTPGWSQEDILSIGETRVQLALLPILSGQLEFQEVAASSVHINLEQAKNGNNNWSSFISGDQESRADIPATDGPDKEKKKDEPASVKQKNLWVDQFSLTDLNINYLDQQLGQELNSKIDELIVNTHEKSHLTASLNGTTNDIPYSLQAKADLLRNILNKEPWQADLDGVVADSPVNLKINLKELDKSLKISISLNVGKTDIGGTLSWLGIVDGLDAESETMKFDASLAGSNLNEILDQSEFRVLLNEGHLNLHDPADDNMRTIQFNKAEFRSEPNQPLTFKLDGEIDAEPVTISLTSERLKTFFTDQDKVYLDLDAQLLETRIKLKGDVNLPITDHSFIVDASIEGKRIDYWNTLIKQKLPSYGPYQLKGEFRIKKDGFQVRNLNAVIGESDLGGNIDIDTHGDSATWSFQLVSNNLQISDFDVEGYSMFNRVSQSPPSNNQNKLDSGSREKLKGQRLTGNTNRKSGQPGELPSINADIQLQARNVASGDDNLGNGTLHLLLTDDSISADKLHLNIPGGIINGRFSLREVNAGIEGQLTLDIEKFDYGVLYRYINPESPAKGLLSTRVDLELKGETVGDLFDHANGTLDFALWPKDIDASLLNVWSINLLLAILPELRKEKSVLNCGVALLDIDDGKLSEELLFIDSTNVWMRGNLRASFQDENVSLALFPTSKTARLFALQAPIRIRGTFDELGAHIKPFDIVRAYLSFITSPLHAPFRRLLGGKMPADASELCGQLIDREYLRALLKEIEATQPTWDDVFDSN